MALSDGRAHGASRAVAGDDYPDTRVAKEENDSYHSCQKGNAARPRTGESLTDVIGQAHTGIPDPRPRQLRDAQQSCRYPTREYQLDRSSLQMAPPRSYLTIKQGKSLTARCG